MNIKQKRNKFWFTLVELIVVITILAILWTISFITLQGYSAQARDSKRISDIQNIKKSLELFSINTWVYPIPDENYEVTYSWSLLRKQWNIWNKVTKNLSRNLSEKPLDPQTNIEYVYSLTYSQKEYELLAIYESGLMTYNNIFNNVNAAKNKYSKIDWTYNQVAVKTPKYIIPTPSIINSEVNGSSIELNKYNIRSQIITWWKNFINTSSWELAINLIVYTWSINNASSDQDKEELAVIIKNAYTGSSLVNKLPYNLVLETNEVNDLVEFVDEIVLWWKTSYTSNKKIYKNCEFWTVEWTVYSWINYEYIDLFHNESINWTKTQSITNWTKDYSSSILCNDWIILISNEQENIVCDSSYIVQWWVCILDECSGTIVNNWISNSTSQWISNSRTYNINPWKCTFKCNNNYTWNWSNCIANTQTKTCGWSIPVNAVASTSSTYIQTWNWTTRSPITTNWWISQTNCDFNCITNYVWNGSFCQVGCRTCTESICFRDVRHYSDSNCTQLIRTFSNWWPASNTHSDWSFFCYPNWGTSPYWNWGPCNFQTHTYTNDCSKCWTY